MSKPKFKVITSRSNQGFFTQVFHTLQHLDAAEKEGMIPVVIWSGGIYKQEDGYNGVNTRNMWDFFFEPVSKYSFEEMYPEARANKYGDFPDIKNEDIQFVSKFRNHSEPHEPPGCWDTKAFPPDICLVNPSHEGRLYINSLMKKFLKIKKVVLDKIDKFYQQNLSSFEFASMHMRMCNDHEGAQGHKIMRRYEKYAKKHLERNPGSKIFVATDRQESLDNLSRRFKGSIVCREESARSPNKYPLQYACQNKKKNRPPGAKVFEDAIIDAVLLSKASRIYRGFSNVASAATFFNPDMKSIYVPKYNEADKKYLEIK